MAQKRDNAHHCCQCGAVVSASWHLPTSCKECGASFDPRPRWILSAVLIVSVAFSVLVCALVRLATANNYVLASAFLIAGFLAFTVLQPLLFKLGVLRLTNVNAKDDTATSIRLSGSDALAKAEGIARAKNYAGSTREVRTAQAKQLKESLDLAKSLRTGVAKHQAAESDAPKAAKNQTQESAIERFASTHAKPHCRFARVTATNEAGIRRMSAMATRIVREHFDPIVGTEQNDYMIERFQAPEAIAQQIQEGFEYYFVLPPKDRQRDDGAKKGARPLGFLALRAQEGQELYLSKFYLIEEMRGKGYARPMMRFVARRARNLGCDHITLRVNRKNYQAILAYEHLGFVRVGELCTNIGNGFVMDDLVYELDLRGET